MQRLTNCPSNSAPCSLPMIEGRSFKELAAESGVPVNTPLARKRYAVLHLRARLQTIYDEFDL